MQMSKRVVGDPGFGACSDYEMQSICMARIVLLVWAVHFRHHTAS